MAPTYPGGGRKWWSPWTGRPCAEGSGGSPHDQSVWVTDPPVTSTRTETEPCCSRRSYVPACTCGNTAVNCVPSGVVSDFQNYTGSTQADLLRLNLAIPPAASPSPYGILGKDLAGFPNGRRVTDDIVAIELRAVAGATIALVDPSYTADGAAAVLVDGTSNTNSPLLKHFPYLGTPAGGYQSLPGTPAT